MPAPVNAGDFWIVEDTQPANACLDVDFAICQWPPIFLGLDEYYLHGGIMQASESTLYMMGGEDSDGSKIQFAYNNRERFALNEYDYSGTLIKEEIKYSYQQIPPFNVRGTAHVQGDIRMMQGISIDGTGAPIPPRYFYNYRDNPWDSGLYYVMSDTAGTTINDTVYSGPPILNGSWIFTINSVAGSRDVVRYPVPIGGMPGDQLDVDSTATDPLLVDIGNEGMVILADDGRMFVWRCNDPILPGDQKLVEFNQDFTVLNSWQFDRGTVRQSFGGAISLFPIAANRICFPGAIPSWLYELNPNGTPDIVHEWASVAPFNVSPNWQAIPGSDGLVWSQFRFDRATPVTGLMNFKGTPDYP